MAQFFEADSSDLRDAAIDSLVRVEAPVEVIAQMLRQGRNYSSEVITGWSTHCLEGLDGVERLFHTYIPTSYDPATPTTVLFELHGGSLVDPVPPEEYLIGRAIWEPSAERYGWILVYPMAGDGATWFNEVGQGNLLGQLAFLKREYNIDENRVFFSGYSAGGAGAIWQAMHNPTPWAGFLSFNGYFDISRLGQPACFPRNLLNRPIRATNGIADGVIPINSVAPFVAQLKALGIDLVWQTYPVAHNVSFFEWERAQTEAFIMNTVRDPHRASVVWETDSVEVGRCDWVRIDEISDIGSNDSFEEMNVYVADERGAFGVSLAFHSSGEFRVVGLQPGSLAHALGVKPGDRVVRIDGIDVVTVDDIEAAVSVKEANDPIEVEVVREGVTIALAGSIPRGDPAFLQPALSGTISVQADHNEIHVRVSHVARFTLLLGSDQFELEKPITVVVNGDRAFSGQAIPDLRAMLEQAWTDRDRQAIYESQIEIIVKSNR